MSPPIPLAQLICDHVWRDPSTQKMTILGAFSTIEASEFPAEFPQIAVYLALTGVHGKVPILIQLIDSPEALPEPIATEELQLDFADPIAIIETAVVLHDVIFPFPGEYRLQLLARGNLVIERRIAVTSPARE